MIESMEEMNDRDLAQKLLSLYLDLKLLFMAGYTADVIRPPCRARRRGAFYPEAVLDTEFGSQGARDAGRQIRKSLLKSREGLVKSRNSSFFVISAKAGIICFQ
ncbi:MAG: hypothetical protein KKA54_12030 [Proteobacteria bacterium]|nr:hypothetical protein [Pseudomonadota bacterium]MBU0967094.1 hypothetical protein [Pseudomonadota bacterium]